MCQSQPWLSLRVGHDDTDGELLTEQPNHHMRFHRKKRGNYDPSLDNASLSWEGARGAVTKAVNLPGGPYPAVGQEANEEPCSRPRAAAQGSSDKGPYVSAAAGRQEPRKRRSHRVLQPAHQR